jgi:hypothetical protein
MCSHVLGCVGECWYVLRCGKVCQVLQRAVQNAWCGVVGPAGSCPACSVLQFNPA